MAITFINTQDVAGVNGGSSGSTDMSGADTFICALISSGGETVSDNLGNTYTVAITSGALKIYIAENADSSAAMVFTISGTSINCAARWLGFSGVKQSGAEDQSAENSFTGANSFQPGSITPTQSDELLIYGISMDADPGGGFAINVNSSFTPTPMYVAGISGAVSGVCYKIQTSAGAENPTASWINNTSGNGAIVSFFNETEPEPPSNIVLMGDGLT